MKTKNPVFSIIVPVYNERDNIQWFYRELIEVSEKLKKPFELVYVNDGSQDGSTSELEKLAKSDQRVINICLARNFGKEAATTAGLNFARGSAVIIIDGDGQHPPSLIPKMYAEWEKGQQQIIGVRTSTQKIGFVKKSTSKLFYYFAGKFGAKNISSNSTDYRLLDREVVDAFNRFGEKKRMTRSILDWTGFRTSYLPFEARERSFGKATYNFKSLLKLAINSYVGSTIKPLYLIGIFGLLISSLAFFAIIFVTVNDVLGDFLHLGVTGTATISLLVTFLVGLLMTAQGIVAVYIANIQTETQNRPIYIINKARSKLE